MTQPSYGHRRSRMLLTVLYWTVLLVMAIFPLSHGAPVAGRVVPEHMIDIAAAGRGTPQTVRFSPDGQWIAVATSTSTILYDARTLTEVWFKENGFAYSLAFSRDSTLLAVLLRDTGIRLLRVTDGSQVARLQIPGTSVSTDAAITFSTDGTLFAAGTSNGAIRVWRVADAQLLDDVGGFETPITQVGFSHDNATLVSINVGFHGPGAPVKPMQIRVWRLSDGVLLQTITPAVAMYPVGLTADGTVVLTLTNAGFQTFGIPAMTLVRTLDTRQLDYDLNGGVFSPDGSFFAAYIGRPTPGIEIWSFDSTMTPPRFTRDVGNAWGIALSADNQSVAATYRAGMLRVWPLETAPRMPKQRIIAPY